MNLQSARKIYFVGIGGIGTSALAQFLLAQGRMVTGSDAVASLMTNKLKELGVSVVIGHHEDQLPNDTDLVVYSPAIPDTNPERTKARALGISECSYPEALGELSKQYSTIVVTGTHGKSTTTAMLGLILEAAGYDPTVIVGSFVPSFQHGNLRIGKGRFLVVEGCEHKANMLNLHPEMIVLTSIEEDHLDFYQNLENIKKTFQSFVDRMSGKGLVILNSDDPVSQTLRIPNAIRYGTDVSSHYRVCDRKADSGVQYATVRRSVPAEEFGEISLKIPGAFNVSNALAAMAAAMEIGIPFETCRRVLGEFAGIWRRFERVGNWKGIEVISDYGHHPTAIRVTLEAAREFFPNKKIILCFQPHQHSRTAMLFDGFVEALSQADALVLPEIYRVEGRTENEEVSSRDLVEIIQEKFYHQTVYFAKNFEDAEQRLKIIVEELPDSVLIIQGAGSVEELARRLTDAENSD